MAKDSFLFIPDISGFTKFVNSTEISHSQHIISELLELIIDADDLGLQVAEVEGDAVLFFGKENVPEKEAILGQVKKTFLKFHEHLALYNSQRICQCGACSTASELSLKFVAHSGEMQLISVKGGEKPYGPDVILAHRLLKNEIATSEYALLTEQTLRGSEAELVINGENVEGLGGQMDYEDAGAVQFKYVPLEGLHKEVPPAAPIKPDALTKDPVKVDVAIQRSADEVFEVLINFERRLEWSRGVDELEYDENKVNRVGTEHRCLVGKDKVGFETITNDFGKGKLVYGERILKAPFSKDISLYYIVENDNGAAKLSAEAHIKPYPIIGAIFKPLIKKKIAQNMKEALSAIKKTLES